MVEAQGAARLDNLVVLDFATAQSSAGQAQGIWDWKRSGNIPHSMSCARQVWYCRDLDFADFPQNVGLGNINIRREAEAYAFLLSFAAGFENKQFHPHNRHQFLVNLKAHHENDPETAVLYAGLMHDINHDANLIHNQITSKLKTRKHEHAARDISGQKKGEKILIISGVSHRGAFSTMTSNMIKVTEAKQKLQKGHHGYITITHPNPEVLEFLKAEVAILERDKVFRSGIQFRPFEDIARLLEESDRVYVDMPMEDIPEHERSFIDAWSGRVRRDNTLTHLKGDPGNRGMSSSMWLGSELDGYYPPEAIREEMTMRARLNKRLVERAFEAFTVCSELRVTGKIPSKIGLLEAKPDILEFDVA